MAIDLSQTTLPAESDADSGARTESAARRGRFLPRFGPAVKSREVLFFMSQVSLMLDIGTPLTNILRALRDQAKSPPFKKILASMYADVNDGRQLSDAMNRHPGVFNKLTVSMISAGETGGFLKLIMDNLVLMQEKRQALIHQIRSTMTYPTVLCLLAVGVMIFVLVAILPKFMIFFEGKERLLPMTTRFFMLASDSLRHAWWAYGLILVGLVLGLRALKASRMGGALLDRSIVGLPVIGRLATKIYTCQLLRTLGYLMESQVLMLQALEITRSTFSNRYYRDFIDRITEHVREGGRFYQPFVHFPYVLESVKEMVTTGEEAGELPRVMLRLAEFYDAEVERELKTLAALLEPAALVVLGAIIGIIVSSIVLPMFKLASAVT